MDETLFNVAWKQAYILSPILFYDLGPDAEQDEWAMWNNGGEL